MDIVPEGQDLIVEARVRPEDADNLREGQQGEVRITAFSGRTMPILHGEVQRVSADRFVDERTGVAYFTTQVSVPRAEIERLLEHDPNGARIRPGLPAQVVVPTRKRTALQYFLEPLNQSIWSSFRES
jgi:HlyD family secretion protein